MYEYSWFIQKIKDYITAGLERDDAITLAIKDCERANIMSEFVREHGSESVNMLFTQFNMEDALEEDIETITKICTAVQECGDTVDIEQIYKKISY
ncbi:MAG: hypothetical protein IJ282_03230 [Lachnospiraceae bacterium]|nr:hypothetical protein [Lachnospiraceae bacterium]